MQNPHSIQRPASDSSRWVFSALQGNFTICLSKYTGTPIKLPVRFLHQLQEQRLTRWGCPAARKRTAPQTLPPS
ncbi:hypothetical protein GCM10027180_16090 [Microbulbifer echini]